MTDYDQRRAAMNRRYEEAYRQLSPAVRRRLERAGVGEAAVESLESHQGHEDVSEWTNLAGPAETLTERMADFLAETFQLPPAVATEIAKWAEARIESEAERRRALLINRIVGMLLRPGNVLVRTHCLAIAAQLDELNNLGYDSLTKAGALLGVHKATMSKGVNEWVDLLELPRPPMLKSEAARESFSNHRKTNHWRKKKCQPQNPPTPSKPSNPPANP